MDERGDFSGKRILFVDDEEIAREFTAEVLGDIGCTVLTAADGRSAGEVFRAEDGRFDLVITDWRMPDVNGRDLIIDLRGRGYRGPFILASAHITKENTKFFHTAFHVKHLLAKPFSADQLTGMVGDVLALPPPSGETIPEKLT